MNGRPLHLGIDLGTTNSTAAVFDGEQVILIRNAQGTTLTPSVVRLDNRGHALVGAKARRLLETDPENTRSEFKRLMGTAQRLEFPASKQSRLPEHLSAEVLKSLREDVQQQLGFLPERAVISVPALFELPQSAATSEAARLAGFERVELIQEPVASALAAGWSGDGESGVWLVYDLGGGTFDASLLETRDGLLRVIGHGGDNFLGGRDFDAALVDHLLEELSAKHGKRVDRADPRHAVSLRKLKLAVEEARIELTRARETTLMLPAAFTVDGEPLDLEATVTAEQVARLCTPLVDRSVAVCMRLLQEQGLELNQVARMVLVGGPTVAPFLRARLGEVMPIPFAQALDPMTLVAQGAALYAATAGLDARSRVKEVAAGTRIWLQYPAMTSDLTPHVVGRLVEGEAGPRPASVKLTRGDGLWESPATPLTPEGAFVLAVDVLPRRPNEFRLEGLGERGEQVVLQPERFTIVQGMTISDPPLSRTVGVALADDRVRVYFERGAPLPARRTFRHQTVDSVAKGSSECVLRIPIVQGELEHAHLCRHIGTLEIAGERVNASLPAGSAVEVTLTLDRGGRLSASALLPSSGQIFEEVAHLLVPEATPEALDASVSSVRTRLAALRTGAFRRGSASSVGALGDFDRSLAEVERDIAAARGGDADSGQKARRALIELDGALETVELEGRWPELDAAALGDMAFASRMVSAHGTASEQKMLEEVLAGVEKARAARQPTELQRQVRVIRQLGFSAYYRQPYAWSWEFDHAASRSSECRDLAAAEKLIVEGRKAQVENDVPTLRRVTEQIWRMLPPDAEERRLGYDSSVS